PSLLPLWNGLCIFAAFLCSVRFRATHLVSFFHSRGCHCADRCLMHTVRAIRLMSRNDETGAVAATERILCLSRLCASILSSLYFSYILILFLPFATSLSAPLSIALIVALRTTVARTL